jgi:hypothetical protein
LTSLTSWSPRTSASTKPASVISATDFTVRCSDAEQGGDVLAGFLGGRGDLAQGSPAAARGAGRGGAGGFDVGRVVRAGGERDGVLAGIGEHVEFLRGIAADRAGVGLHGAEVQAQAGEDAAVGRVMFRIRAPGIGVRWNE